MSPEDKDIAKQVEGSPPQGDPWRVLSSLTPARLGLGRVGAALRTASHLGFLADHAFARDAVHAPFSAAEMAKRISEKIGPAVAVTSLCPDRATYLRRPDLGRRIRAEDRALLEEVRAAAGDERHAEHQGFDVAITVCDGLSATGVLQHGVGLTREIYQRLVSAGLTVAPLVVASMARVALGDDTGETLGARVSVVIIGERPGLSAADSLGIYLTFAPRVGRTDAERNCISNVHPPVGLDYASAAHKTVWLVREALVRGLTGVELKDSSEGLALVGGSAEEPEPERNGRG